MAVNDWMLGYPVNYTIQGDLTMEAIYKHIQELNKIYGHLNYIRVNTEGGASIAISGFAPTPDDLPTSGVEVNTVYITNGDTYNLYVWNGTSWNKLDLQGLPISTTEVPGLTQLGTLAGVRSDIPSPSRVITEEILANYASSGGQGVPSGTIVMWWGNKQNVPAGWAFCDGSSGTPDLRNKFAKCVGDAKDVGGATGGSANTTLVEANLPVHRHSVSISVTSTGQASGHSHSLSSTSHSHSVNLSAANGGSHYHPLQGPAIITPSRWAGVTVVTHMSTGSAVINCSDPGISEYTNTAGAHAHTVQGSTAVATISGSTSGGTGTISVSGTVQGNTGNVGNGTAFSNEPLFMELLYIMKL
jgi:hypothetical protein